tara:strand:- start:785 stop:1060 length:276 start_codon:yes stop_codon:yes gene_type:complete
MVGCRSSGLLTNTTEVIVSGQIKLISVHGANDTAGALTATIYDNTTNSGTIVARLTVPANSSMEFDMHGVLCKLGLTAVVPPSLDITVEYI